MNKVNVLAEDYVNHCDAIQFIKPFVTQLLGRTWHSRMSDSTYLICIRGKHFLVQTHRSQASFYRFRHYKTRAAFEYSELSRTVVAYLSFIDLPKCKTELWMMETSLNVPRSVALQALTNPGPAEQPPLAVFPDCTRRYWVDMWSAHRILQLHFQLSKADRYFFIQVTTQFIRSRGWVDPVPDPTPPEKNPKECPGIEPGTSVFVVFNANH
jgi:hypothetical protein